MFGRRLLISATPICLAALALPMPAQSPSDMPLEVRLWRTVGTPRVVDAREVPPPAQAPAEASVSADLLRHPLSRKARQMLQKAQRAAEAGDHAGAIRQFEETLAKYPDSGAWTYSWLGVEYIKTDQFDAAVTSFEQAVLLLPHDAVSRSNFGLSLATTGQYDRAGAGTAPRPRTRPHQLQNQGTARRAPRRQAPRSPAAQSQLSTACKPSLSR